MYQIMNKAKYEKLFTKLETEVNNNLSDKEFFGILFQRVTRAECLKLGGLYINENGEREYYNKEGKRYYPNKSILQNKKTVRHFIIVPPEIWKNKREITQ